MKRLSIIVPMYNVESYVERCLRSLEDQDIQSDEYEIICVNDGSPDNSRGVVIRLQQEFDNITLIEQENQGVASARNNGIDKASGKYVLFIDPDDYVDALSLGSRLKNVDKKEAQVSFLGFTFLNEDGSIRKQVFNENHTSQIYLGTDAYFLTRRDGRTDPDRIWAVLIKTEFLNNNNLRYLPGVPYLEDGEFIARILCLAECCLFDGRSFYHRTTRVGSATNSQLFLSEKATYGFLLSVKNLKMFQANQNLSERQRYFLNQPICKFVFLTLISALRKPIYRNYKSIRKELVIFNLKKLELKGVVRPYKNFAIFYNYFIVAFILNAYLKEIKDILKAFLNGSKNVH